VKLKYATRLNHQSIKAPNPNCYNGNLKGFSN